MRIILTGGGTGGHIIPNIAVIEEIDDLVSKGKLEEVEILYVGSISGADREIVERSLKSQRLKVNVEFKGVLCGKLRRYFSFENLIDFFKVPIGIVQSFFLISKFQPNVIFSKGGFVSVPVVVGAWLAGKRKIIVHESDVIPGLANKITAKFASEICLAFKETQKYFRKAKNVHIVGNPVRKKITSGLRNEGFSMTKFTRELPVILIMGGSQGAQQLNLLVWRNLKRLLPICQIIHICGKGKKGAAFDGLNFKNYAHYEFVENELPHLYAISDLIISRAGANSLAEIAALKKPSVLVPLGLAASRGDQIENAKIFEKHGVARVLDGDEVMRDEFFEVVNELMTSKKTLKEMEDNFEAFVDGDSVEVITNLILKG